MLHYAAFHLGLHCLQKYSFRVSRIQRVKGDLCAYRITIKISCSDPYSITASLLSTYKDKQKNSLLPYLEKNDCFFFWGGGGIQLHNAHCLQGIVEVFFSGFFTFLSSAFFS